MKTRVNNTITCDKCYCYKSPMKVLSYGWVKCSKGNIINSKARACHKLTTKRQTKKLNR